MPIKIEIVEVKDMAKNYLVGKTLKKLLRDLLMYGIPIVGTFAITKLGTTAELTIGGFIGLVVKWVADYIKHK